MAQKKQAAKEALDQLYKALVYGKPVQTKDGKTLNPDEVKGAIMGIEWSIYFVDELAFDLSQASGEEESE